MNGAPLTAFERRFGLEQGEGLLVLSLLGDALGSDDPTVGRLLLALRDDRPLAEGLGLPAGAVEALYARATQWFAVGRAERAEPLFRILCLLDPTGADYWVAHGVCLHMADRVDEARLAFETANRLRPDWALPGFHLAALAIRARRWSEARRHLERFEAHAGSDLPPDLVREAHRLAEVVRSNRADAS